MIRPLTIATFLMACGSGLYLYQSKHEAQVLDRMIEKSVRDATAYRDQSRLLAAEWTMLNDPETLRRFSDIYLKLKTITPSQFTSLADLDSRLPPIELPASSQGMDQEEPPLAVAEVPVATVPAAARAAGISTDAAPAIVSDDVFRGAPRLSAPAFVRPPERKSVASRPAPADAAYRPTVPVPVPAYKPPVTEAAYKPYGADTVFKPYAMTAAPPPRDLASAESRPAEPRSGNPRPADRGSSRPAEARGTDTRLADIRQPMTPAQPRPVVAAAPPPTTTTSRPSFQGPGQDSSGGSLLGMARGSAQPPAPRPVAVNAAQWYHAN